MRVQQDKAERGEARRLGWKKSALYGLVTVAAFFAMLELVLRLAGFRFATGPVQVQVTEEVVAGAYRRSVPRRTLPVLQTGEGEFDYSAKTIWTPVAGVAPFNRDGFVGPELPRRRSGRLRIACLGDSCTQLGTPAYPSVLGERLGRRWDCEVEVLNAGVVGYSTFQGLVRLEEEVLRYDPDVVTLYFGWNDHWSLDRLRDPELARAMREPWFGWVDSVGWSRVVQAVLWVHVELREALAGDAARTPPEEYVLRVDLASYRKNLRRLISACRAHGAVPILITAPTSIEPGTTPDHYTTRMDGEAGRLFGSLAEMHEAYVEATRATAEETGTAVVDAYTAFGDGEGLMKRDQIHLTAEGIERMAELLAAVIVGQVESRPALAGRVMSDER